MKLPSTQSPQILAAPHGWSHEFAEGFVKGAASRMSRMRVSTYCMVGIDEYSMGFRAGYFPRDDAAAAPAEIPPARDQAAGGA